MTFTLIGGYFVSRFVLQPNNLDLDEEAEIENLIRFMMDGLRKQG